MFYPLIHVFLATAKDIIVDFIVIIHDNERLNFRGGPTWNHDFDVVRQN